MAPAAAASRAGKAQKRPTTNKASKPSSKAPLKNTPAGKPAPSAPAANRSKTAGPAPVTAASQKASVKSTAAPATPASAPVQATAAKAPTSAPRSGKTRLSRAEANSQPVPAAPSHPANRFADRFAPAKPSARHLPEPILDIKPAGKPDPKLANAWKSKAGRDLSEPELLAMPDSEYMNDKQIDFFKSRLNALKADLLSNAGETTEHLREDTTIVPDPADRATIEEEHALELRTRDRERKLLRKISQSLARIDAGEYGYCEETGEPIGLGRLLARPTATLSLEAQQRRELKQRMFGD
ncbi:MAG: RNA polymerase-binding protein DksA [Betaproteobacteria bacterium]